MSLTKLIMIIFITIVVSSSGQSIKGSYFDSNADGTMDSISLTFTSSISQADLNTMNFIFVWLKNTAGFDTLWINTQGADFNILDSISVGWRVSGYSLKQGVTYIGDTWGQSFLIQRNILNGRTKRSDIEMVDAMPPVINYANYIAFNSPVITDTIYVEFSEEIIFSNEPSPFKFWNLSKPEYLVEFDHASINNNVSTFYVIWFVDGVVPSEGDSVWINESGKITDLFGNQQTNGRNRKELISFEKVLSIKSVSYHETDSIPDGLIDLIKVSMNNKPSPAMLDSLVKNITLPDYRKFYNISILDLSLTETGFQIAVSQSELLLPVTSINNNDVFKVSESKAGNELIMYTERPILDSIAPVIKKANFIDGIWVNPQQPVPDTLIVEYSEEVRVSENDTIFGFSKKDGSQFYMETDPVTMMDGKIHTYLIDYKEQFVETGDSVWIKKEGEITDVNQGLVQLKNTAPIALNDQVIGICAENEKLLNFKFNYQIKNGFLMFPTPRVNGIMALELFNSKGQVVIRKRKQLNSNSFFSIPVSSLPNSTYIIRIQTKENSYIKRVQILHR